MGKWAHTLQLKKFGKVCAKVWGKESDMPEESILRKRVNLANDDLQELMEAKVHTAAEDETIVEIADLYGVDADVVVRMNKRTFSASTSSQNGIPCCARNVRNVISHIGH